MFGWRGRSNQYRRAALFSDPDVALLIPEGELGSSDLGVTRLSGKSRRQNLSVSVLLPDFENFDGAGNESVQYSSLEGPL